MSTAPTLSSDYWLVVSRSGARGRPETRTRHDPRRCTAGPARALPTRPARACSLQLRNGEAGRDAPGLSAERAGHGGRATRARRLHVPGPPDHTAAANGACRAAERPWPIPSGIDDAGRADRTHDARSIERGIRAVERRVGND